MTCGKLETGGVMSLVHAYLLLKMGQAERPLGNAPSGGRSRFGLRPQPGPHFGGGQPGSDP